MSTRYAIFALYLAILVFAANCAPKPTSKEMDGKIKGKASLRLSDGSTISQDGSDEYNPYLVKLDDGYLVLVFGSNRNGNHNIFMTKSIEPYDGFTIPFFDPPVAVTENSAPIDDPSPIRFAAVAETSTVVLYVNNHNFSNAIYKGVVSDPSNPDIPGLLQAITNTSENSYQIIGVSADGQRLITNDLSGIAYIIDPNTTNTASAFGGNLDYTESATQVRYDNSGQNDSYMGVYYGSSFAATATEYFGPIFDFDTSLAFSGLYLTGMNTFYGNAAYEDLVLFTANDGFSDDIYVVTSHTSGMLWSLVAFFGFDTFLPPAPLADHWYDFESYTCPTGPTDTGPVIGGWDPTSCTVVTSSAGSYDGSNYGLFTNASSSVMDLGVSPRNLNTDFTISAWVWVDAAPPCGSTCLIVANSAIAANTDGFRLFIDSSDFSVHFVTGDGASSETDVATYPGYMAAGEWHHIAVTVNTLSTFAFVYIDGSIMNSGLPFIVAGGFNTNQVITFGRTSGTASLNGRMDNIKIYERELDPLEVLALYLE